MQGIYTYIPETTHCSYSVVTIPGAYIASSNIVINVQYNANFVTSTSCLQTKVRVREKERRGEERSARLVTPHGTKHCAVVSSGSPKRQQQGLYLWRRHSWTWSTLTWIKTCLPTVEKRTTTRTVFRISYARSVESGRLHAWSERISQARGQKITSHLQ